MRYATDDTQATAGAPVYQPNDEPLPATGDVRQAGINCLILAYSTRRHVRRWLDVAGGKPLDADTADAVRADLGAALELLAPSPTTSTRPATKQNDRDLWGKA